MVSRTWVIPRSAVRSIAVIGLVVCPVAPAAAAFLSILDTAGAGAETTTEFNQPPDIQSAIQFGATGPVTGSVTADRGALARFVVGHGVSSGVLDFGYFAGTADSQATVPRGSIDTDGTGREFEHFASSYADVAADAQASFLVTPVNPALIGTMGTVVVPVDVHGTLSATLSPDVPRGRLRGDSAAQVLWSMNAGTAFGTLFGTLSGTVDTFGTGYGDMPGLHTLTFDLMLGVPTDINLHYELHTTAAIGSALGVGGQAEGLAAFGSTFRWMGISQVLDVDGNPIEYSIASDSGFDWTQAAPLTPVPAPPAFALLATALGAVCARARPRRNRGT